MRENKDILYIPAFQPNPSASQRPIDGAVPIRYVIRKSVIIYHTLPVRFPSASLNTKVPMRHCSMHR